MLLITGINPCINCILHNPSKIREIFINIDKKNDFIRLVNSKNLKKITKFIKKNEFKQFENKESRYLGDIAIMRENYQFSNLEDIAHKQNENSLIIMADQITDQNNLGNIIRTSLLMGADGLVLSNYSTANITSTTSITSAGAVELLNIHIAKNLNRTIEKLKDYGYWIYTLDVNGKILDKNFKFDKKSILILGNETKGARKKVLDKSDFILKISQKNINGIDSYNAANSLAIATYHYKLYL